MTKKILSFVVFLVVLLIFCLYAVLAIRPSEGGIRLTDAEIPDGIPTVESEDVGLLARRYERSVPVLPDGSCRGRLETVTFEGQYARLLTLDYGSLSVQCVWPATAAPLLLRPGLTVLSLWADDRYRFSVLSMPAVYAEKDGEYCLYFSDDSAAYCFSTAALSRDDFLAAARRLAWYR